MFTTDWTALRFQDYIDHGIENTTGRPFYREHVASRRREVHQRIYRYGASLETLAHHWKASGVTVAELESDIDFLYERGLIR